MFLFIWDVNRTSIYEEESLPTQALCSDALLRKAHAYILPADPPNPPKSKPLLQLNMPTILRLGFHRNDLQFWTKSADLIRGIKVWEPLICSLESLVW